MTAYNIPEEVTYETTASDGSTVSITFKKGEAAPADDLEKGILEGLVAAGLATTSANKPKNKTAPTEPKE